MKGLRSSESVIALVLLASLVGHFAIQKNFERRSRAMLRLALADRSLSPQVPLACPSMDLPEIDRVKLPRFLSDVQTGGRIMPALEIQGDDSAEESLRDREASTTVPIPADSEPSALSARDA